MLDNTPLVGYLFRMIIFSRSKARSDGRIGFDFPDLDEGSRTRLIEEIGLIVRAAGEPHGIPDSAQLYNVMFVRDDDTQGHRLGGFSVPAEIAEDVAAALVSHGHLVE
jgi:hypothetical protein